MTVKDFYPRQRVKLHPATDLFMRGCRYGDVVRVGGRWVYVFVDRLCAVRKIAPHNLIPVPAWQQIPKEPKSTEGR